MTRTFSGVKTHDQVFEWLNPDMPLDERYRRERLLSDFVEIPESTWDYFLNVLPPMHWRNGHFAICEATSADVRLGLFQVGNRYFAAHVSDFEHPHTLADVHAEIAKNQPLRLKEAHG